MMLAMEFMVMSLKNLLNTSSSYDKKKPTKQTKEEHWYANVLHTCILCKVEYVYTFLIIICSYSFLVFELCGKLMPTLLCEAFFFASIFLPD